MKTNMNVFLVITVAVPQDQLTARMNSATWLAIGAIIALLLFVYLVISLVKPEKF